MRNINKILCVILAMVICISCFSIDAEAATTSTSKAVPTIGTCTLSSSGVVTVKFKTLPKSSKYDYVQVQYKLYRIKDGKAVSKTVKYMKANIRKSGSTRYVKYTVPKGYVIDKVRARSGKSNKGKSSWSRYSAHIHDYRYRLESSTSIQTVDEKRTVVYEVPIFFQDDWGGSSLFLATVEDLENDMAVAKFTSTDPNWDGRDLEDPSVTRTPLISNDILQSRCKENGGQLIGKTCGQRHAHCWFNICLVTRTATVKVNKEVVKTTKTCHCGATKKK